MPDPHPHPCGDHAVSARFRAVGAALLTLAFLAGCAGSGHSASAGQVVRVESGSQAGYAGARLDTPYAKPALTFTDTAGHPFAFDRDTTAPVTLVFFGYTSCPDVCNAVLADVAAALRRLRPATRARTQMVFVTTDPARDDPKRIRDYLARFDPSFVGLTAPLPTIEKAASALGVALEGTSKLPDGGYEVTHGTQVIGFGPDGKGWLVWTQPTAVGALRADIERLAAS